MNTKLKGTLLELIVGRLLQSCGFKSVNQDGVYICQNNNGLMWINGKGAKHDADVLVDPPFQVPFSYPTRLLVECKSYQLTSPIGLPIIRGALGLRNDINEFEIVTLDHLKMRKGTNRNGLAVERRCRYNYQVAVCSISGFTKPAIEFAMNHKIPLIDLTQVMNNIQNDFNEVMGQSDSIQNDIYNRLIEHNLYTTHGWTGAMQRIAQELERAENELVVGMVNYGDMIFFRSSYQDKEILYKAQQANTVDGNYCTIHFDQNQSREWYISCMWNSREAKLYFKLPDEYLRLWVEENYSKTSALDIKEKYLKDITLITTYGNFNVWLNMAIPEKWFSAMRHRIDI